jgi:hypothetical protein
MVDGIFVNTLMPLESSFALTVELKNKTDKKGVINFYKLVTPFCLCDMVKKTISNDSKLK